MSVTAFRTALRRHFDLDQEAEALLLDWLLSNPLDELVRRAVLDLARDAAVDVESVGVKLAPGDYRADRRTHVTVLRFQPCLRCPADPFSRGRENGPYDA